MPPAADPARATAGPTARAAGFAEPATESAGAFRAALDALARPGRAVTLAPLADGGPQGLSPAAAVLLLTLSDPGTPVWLAPGGQEAARWLAFHTGAPETRDRAAATLAAGPWEALVPLDGWPAGTPDYPDRSATLIVDVPALTGGPALALSGPGIAGGITASPALPAGAAGILAANAARFPLGVDLFLTAGSAIMGLPRSTRVAPARAAEGG